MPLDATGLTVPTLAELRTAWRAAVAASGALGPNWQTTPGSILGQIAEPILTQIASVYDLAVQVYDSFWPDTAEEVHQDLVTSVIGVVREPATYTIGTCELTGVAPNVIPAGTQLRVPDGPTVETDANVTMTGGADPAACTAIEIGEVEILATTVTEIVTPVFGLTSVDNAAAFTTGQEVETDALLRNRREGSLVAPSSSTDYGIGSALAALTSVDYARAVSDRTLNTVRCLVYPNTADTDDVATVVWDKTPAGIELVGLQSAIVTDAAGNSQTVRWDWVADVTITVVINLTGIPNSAANIATAKTATLELFDGLAVGQDVYANQIEAAAVAALRTEGQIATTSGATVDAGATVVIDIDELAVTTTGDITVNIVP